MYYLMIHQIQSCRPAGKRSNFLDCPFLLFKANSVSCLLMLELTWSAYLLNPKLHLSNFFNIYIFDGLCLGQALFTPFFLLRFSPLCLLLLFKKATCTPMKSMNTAATIIISRQSRQSSSRLGLAAPPLPAGFPCITVPCATLHRVSHFPVVFNSSVHCNAILSNHI